MTTSPIVFRPEPATPSFYGMSRSRLAERLARLGVESYRADQIFAWVYQKHLRDSTGMTNLPSALRSRFEDICDLSLPRLHSVHGTRDGATQKFVLELHDGARVECVSMRTTRRVTLCLSSQVGCALKCSFCATGLMGLKRNLRADEIVGQVLVMGDAYDWQDERFNLVFMGMGEPLANYDAVIRAVRVLTQPRGLNL